jgi:hypothetical protein
MVCNNELGVRAACLTSAVIYRFVDREQITIKFDFKYCVITERDDISTMIRIITGMIMILMSIVPTKSASAAPASDGLRQPPGDTLEAARVRIWIPVENGNRCRAVVQIHDSTDRVVRNLLDGLLTRGYHNFYWDKLDDSDQFVPPGHYQYQAAVCGKVHEGMLQAVYLPGELESEVHLVDSLSAARFEWQLKTDSAIINAFVENSRGVFIDSVFSNYRAYKGQYDLEWSPPPGYAGRFILYFQVDQYTHRIAFRLSRSSQRPGLD